MKSSQRDEKRRVQGTKGGGKNWEDRRTQSEEEAKTAEKLLLASSCLSVRSRVTSWGFFGNLFNFH
jgi:hypothetical protein